MFPKSAVLIQAPNSKALTVRTPTKGNPPLYRISHLRWGCGISVGGYCGVWDEAVGEGSDGGVPQETLEGCL